MMVTTSSARNLTPRITTEIRTEKGGLSDDPGSARLSTRTKLAG